MSNARIRRDLPNDEYQAAVGANNPSASNVFATIADLVSAGGIQHAIAAGTNTYTATITGVTAYTDGDVYVIRFTNGNDADSTININGLGAITLTKQSNIQVTGGDIISNQEIIIVYDGTNFQCINVAPNQLFAYVTNDDAVTINKGQPVYAFSATGNRMSVKLAFNTSDATSAQTVGVVFSTSIAPNQRGFVITQGVIDGLDTSMYAAGNQLYLGATAGSLTNVKPYAPNHLVYIGIVERANAGNGQIYVKPQNGYELEELHDVDLITVPPINGDALVFNGSLWVPGTASASFGKLGIADSNGQYTYYSDYTSAMAAAVAGQTIEQFADIVEPNNVTIVMTPNVNINMHGHSYTCTYSAAGITLFQTTGTTQIFFINGSIILDSGAVGHTAIGGSVTATSEFDCTGLFIKVISSGGLGTAWTSRGIVRNLRAESIDSNCASFVRSTGYDCVFSTTGTGTAANVGLASLGSPGSLFDSRVSSLIVRNGGSVGNVHSSSTTCLGGANVTSSSLGTTTIDTEYTTSTFAAISITDSAIGAISARAADNAIIIISNCITSAITISDDSQINSINVLNCTISALSAGTNCITKAAGVNLTATIKYANNVFRVATTPINATILQGIVNTEDNQGNILV